MSMSDQDTQPEGYRGEQVKSRVIEGGLGWHKVVNHTKVDGIGSRSERNQRISNMNPPCQDTGPAGQLGE